MVWRLWVCIAAAALAFASDDVSFDETYKPAGEAYNKPAVALALDESYAGSNNLKTRQQDITTASEEEFEKTQAYYAVATGDEYTMQRQRAVFDHAVFGMDDTFFSLIEDATFASSRRSTAKELAAKKDAKLKLAPLKKEKGTKHANEVKAKTLNKNEGGVIMKELDAFKSSTEGTRKKEKKKAAACLAFAKKHCSTTKANEKRVKSAEVQCKQRQISSANYLRTKKSNGFLQVSTSTDTANRLGGARLLQYSTDAASRRLLGPRRQPPPPPPPPPYYPPPPYCPQAPPAPAKKKCDDCSAKTKFCGALGKGACKDVTWVKEGSVKKAKEAKINAKAMALRGRIQKEQKQKRNENRAYIKKVQSAVWSSFPMPTDKNNDTYYNTLKKWCDKFGKPAIRLTKLMKHKTARAQMRVLFEGCDSMAEDFDLQDAEAKRMNKESQTQKKTTALETCRIRLEKDGSKKCIVDNGKKKAKKNGKKNAKKKAKKMGTKKGKAKKGGDERTTSVDTKEVKKKKLKKMLKRLHEKQQKDIAKKRKENELSDKKKKENKKKKEIKLKEKIKRD